MNYPRPHTGFSLLRSAYLGGRLTPSAMIEQLVPAVDAADPAIWISRVPTERLRDWAGALAERDAASLPLYGIPFAIKDNIDLAGFPTTAGCPEYAYMPAVSAPVVQALIDAGAIPLGKTNLDQFATGLVGVRSPYGVPGNSFHPDYIPGGSSSGSAIAVANGLCTFALGTDTAGSGRVPAAFNHLVGLKPTCGLLSTTGVVPACRTLDCVSIFAGDLITAQAVYAVAARYDRSDPYARRKVVRPSRGDNPVIGIPRPDQLAFFGSVEYPPLWEAAVGHLREVATVEAFDFTPFLAAATLLYGGPWVAERYAGIRGFIDAHPEALHPTTFKIISGGKEPRAFEAFEAAYALAALRRQADEVFERIDFLATPTAGRIYTLAEVEADPIQLNSNLGYYTNFMNLLDLCAVAVPAGFGAETGLPFGITLAGPAFSDDEVIALAEGFLK